ncbi:PREDICTED: uncharacterized protein LOC106808366 isoform X2 [Priapulus caudatus]|uniref:Uncharacterized protein LOC106808366 isoform X2 n=1 Tax=Priapulus caudatus TaxID=37621 RepID=A0ABM1E2X8_PRICU|nr:PREDICTED: uncharacterized protein LOC106808366 isoform X2 [Priapulus caudatus]
MSHSSERPAFVTHISDIIARNSFKIHSSGDDASAKYDMLGMKVERYQKVIYAINGLLAACVIIFVIVSIWLLKDSHMTLIPVKFSDASFIYAYYALIVQAGVVQALGCYATYRLKKKLLYVFWFWLLLLLIGDIVVGLIWVLRFNALSASLPQSLLDDLQSEYGQVGRSTRAWDDVQSNDQCCGVNGPMDYQDSSWFKNVASTQPAALSMQVLPSSCCKINSNSKVVLNPICMQSYDNVFIYKQGCKKSVASWLQSTANKMFLLGYCLIAFFKAVSLAILWREIRKLGRKLQKMWRYSQSNLTSADESCIERATNDDCENEGEINQGAEIAVEREVETDETELNQGVKPVYGSSSEHQQWQQQQQRFLQQRRMRRSISLVDLTESGISVKEVCAESVPKSTGKITTSSQQSRPRALNTNVVSIAHAQNEPGQRRPHLLIATVHQRGVRSRRSLNFDSSARHRFKPADIDLFKEIMHRKMADKLHKGETPADNPIETGSADLTVKHKAHYTSNVGDVTGRPPIEAINMQLLNSQVPKQRNIATSGNNFVYKKCDDIPHVASVHANESAQMHHGRQGQLLPAPGRNSSPVTVQHVRSARGFTPQKPGSGQSKGMHPDTDAARRGLAVGVEPSRLPLVANTDSEESPPSLERSLERSGREALQQRQMMDRAQSRLATPSSRRLSSAQQSQNATQCGSFSQEDITEKEIKTKLNNAKAMLENQTSNSRAGSAHELQSCDAARPLVEEQSGRARNCLSDNRTCESINVALIRNKNRGSRSHIKHEQVHSTMRDTEIFTIS